VLRFMFMKTKNNRSLNNKKRRKYQKTKQKINSKTEENKIRLKKLRFFQQRKKTKR
jgi:hypothetical protein